MTKHLWAYPARSADARAELARLDATRRTSTSIQRASLVDDGLPSVLADVIGARHAPVAISPTVVEKRSGPSNRS